jgi:hypothetical protein
MQGTIIVKDAAQGTATPEAAATATLDPASAEPDASSDTCATASGSVALVVASFLLTVYLIKMGQVPDVFQHTC